jgi:hypothetical protein
MAWVPSLVPAVVAGHVKGCGGGLARFSSDSWRIVAAFDLCLDGDTDRHAELRVAHQRAHPRRASPPPCQRGDTSQTATTSGGGSPQYRLHALVAHRISLGRHDHKTKTPYAIERDFRIIKADDLDLRPIHHRLDDRVRVRCGGVLGAGMLDRSMRMHT